MAKTLTLVRHGDIGPALDGRFVGRRDVPLSPLGRKQATELGRRLGSGDAARLLTSPLVRARETAEAIADAAKCPVSVDEDLAEIDFGDWDGMTFDEIEAVAPEAVAQWGRFDPAFAFPNGESLEGFLRRMQGLAARIVALSEEAIVAVTHGGVIRALVCEFLGLSPRQYVLFEVSRGSMTTLNLFGERGVLTGLNECPGE